MATRERQENETLALVGWFFWAAVAFVVGRWLLGHALGL